MTEALIWLKPLIFAEIQLPILKPSDLNFEFEFNKLNEKGLL